MKNQRHIKDNWDRFWYGVVDALGTIQTNILVYVIKQYVWRSFDGRVTPIREMTDGHLRNAYNMLLRKDDPRSKPIRELFQREADRRGINLKALRGVYHISGRLYPFNDDTFNDDTPSWGQTKR